MNVIAAKNESSHNRHSPQKASPHAGSRGSAGPTTFTDPLGAVPALPFGHLHEVWRAFLSRMQAGDEIWTFSARWREYWSGPERREGYVRVREGKPTEFLLMEREYLEEDESQEKEG